MNIIATGLQNSSSHIIHIISTRPICKLRVSSARLTHEHTQTKNTAGVTDMLVNVYNDDKNFLSPLFAQKHWKIHNIFTYCDNYPMIQRGKVQYTHICMYLYIFEIKKNYKGFSSHVAYSFVFVAQHIKLWPIVECFLHFFCYARLDIYRVWFIRFQINMYMWPIDRIYWIRMVELSPRNVPQKQWRRW